MYWLCLQSQEAVINAEGYMFELRILKAYDSLLNFPTLRWGGWGDYSVNICAATSPCVVSATT